MAARNRRYAGNISEDVENLSEHAEKDVRRLAEDGATRSSMAALSAFEAFNGPVAKAMGHNRAMFQKLLHAMHEESLRFVNRRLEHTGRAIESSRDCQGVMGLVSVQQEFLMDLARDYAEQSRRFADIVQELAEDGASGLAEMTDAVADPVRAAARRTEANGGTGRSAAP